MAKIWTSLNSIKRSLNKLEELADENVEESEVKTEDAVSIAYDLSEYGDAMVERLLIDPQEKKVKNIKLNDLKSKLAQIIEVENEDENQDNTATLESSQRKGITAAQLEAYQNLLEKIERENQNIGAKKEDDASTVLWTLASTKSNSGQTLYSMRKIKDYLQKRAKQAKQAELERIRLEEKEAVKKLIEEDKKSRKVLCNIFNPLLTLNPVTEVNQENEEAKDKFVKRIYELTAKENDPYKKIKEMQKQKKKNPDKVHMMAVETFLKELENRAIEEKKTAVQQRPLNEEVVKKQLSKGMVSKFQITKCDLCILGILHSPIECINHQQIMKTKGVHEAAQEVKGILKDQIKFKKEKERKEIIEKRTIPGIQGNEGYPPCKELSKDEIYTLKLTNREKLKEGLEIQINHKHMQSKMNADNSKTETYNFITKHNRQMSTPDLRNIDKLNTISDLKRKSMKKTQKYYKDESKNDVIRAFFVDNNKPISVLPTDPETRLSFKQENKDSNVLFADANRFHRNSSSDFNVMKLEAFKLPSVYQKMKTQKSLKNFNPKTENVKYEILQPIDTTNQEFKYVVKRKKEIEGVPMF